MSPFFSIIIPTYNRAAFLTKAIESVLSQTFQNWELIIVDDGSTDNTKECVLNYMDDRIKYIYQSNQERSAARNKGINNVMGKYICFLDSDDHYLSNRLELIKNEISKQREPITMFYTGIRFEKNHQISEKPELPKENYSNKFDFIIKTIIGVPQVCIAKEVLKKYNFNTKYSTGEDLELWLRIINEFPVIYIPNQFTVIANDHDERSVNERQGNPGKEQLKLLKYLFKKGNPGYLISNKIKKEKISDTCFSIARHYMYNNNKTNAIIWILKALFNMRNHYQQIHWFFCLKTLFSGNIPDEYKKLKD